MSDCVGCGGPIVGKRSDAIYCGAKCRMRVNTRKYQQDKERNAERSRKYYHAHRDERVEYMRNRRKEQGGEPERVRRIAELGYEFDGACEICGAAVDVPNVDHDHITGKARGYLCRSCNLGLGNFKDSRESLASAIAYLDTHSSLAIV